MALPKAEKIKSFYSTNLNVPTFSLPQITQISTEAHIRIITNTTVIVSSRTLLKLLALLRQNVLSDVQVVPDSQNTTIKDSHFHLSATKQNNNFYFIYVTVTFNISHPKSSHCSRGCLWAPWHVLHSVGIYEPLLFGKRERKIIKKKTQTSIYIYMCILQNVIAV